MIAMLVTSALAGSLTLSEPTPVAEQGWLLSGPIGAPAALVEEVEITAEWSARMPPYPATPYRQIRSEDGEIRLVPAEQLATLGEPASGIALRRTGPSGDDPMLMPVERLELTQWVHSKHRRALLVRGEDEELVVSEEHLAYPESGFVVLPDGERLWVGLVDDNDAVVDATWSAGRHLRRVVEDGVGTGALLVLAGCGTEEGRPHLTGWCVVGRDGERLVPLQVEGSTLARVYRPVRLPDGTLRYLDVVDDHILLTPPRRPAAGTVVVVEQEAAPLPGHEGAIRPRVVSQRVVAVQ